GRNEIHHAMISVATSMVDSQRTPAISLTEPPAAERRLAPCVDARSCPDPALCADSPPCACPASAWCDACDPERSAALPFPERAIQRSAPPSSASANATENRTGSARRREEWARSASSTLLCETSSGPQKSSVLRPSNRTTSTGCARM